MSFIKPMIESIVNIVIMIAMIYLIGWIISFVEVRFSSIGPKSVCWFCGGFFLSTIFHIGRDMLKVKRIIG